MSSGDFSLPWTPPPDRLFDVVGLGCAAMDIICLLDRYPASNEKVHALSMERQGGGPVGTALTALARLGFTTFFIGRVGDDASGRFILDEFEREGVEVHPEAVDKEGVSRVSVCLVDVNRAERTVVSYGGPPADDEPDVSRARAAVTGSLLHVDGYEMPAAVAAAKEARGAGAAVVYDCGSVYDGTEELLGYTDVAVTSEKFAREMFRGASLDEVCYRLQEYGPAYTGVTLGPKGAVGLDGERFFEVPAFAVRVVDTTGAGDAFHGGLDAGILLGFEFERAMVLASAVAAIKCTKPGGRAGLPAMEELLGFLRERGYNVAE